MDVVMHTCNSRTQQAEARGLRVLGQLGLHSNPVYKRKEELK
jgi:hypothetical protein